MKSTAETQSKQTQFTPGPWHVAPIGGDTYIGILDGRFVADMRREQCENEAQLAECDANARLIAASPEMFSALDRLLKCTELNLDDLEESTRDALRQAHAALVKASGEKSALSALSADKLSNS